MYPRSPSAPTLRKETLEELPVLKWEGKRPLWAKMLAQVLRVAPVRASCGHFHLVQPCLSLTLVGAGALEAVPTTGTAGRSWQGQATKASKPGRGKLPRAGGEGLSQEESRVWGQWLCHPCEPWSEASLEPSIAQGLRRL